VRNIPVIICAAIAFAVASGFSVYGQGSFQNLNFEATTLLQAQPLGLVDANEALPDWSAFDGTNGPLSQVGFKAWIGGTPIALFATNGLTGTSIEGGFSVFLVGAGVNYPGGPLPFTPACSIAQTASLPSTVQSIIFKARPGTSILIVSLGGMNVPFSALSTKSDCTVYAGDVAPFAGRSLELKFTVGYRGTGWNLDSVEFVNQSIPAPLTNHLNISRVFDAVQLSFFTESNKTYQIEVATEVADTNWFPLGDEIIGTGTTRVRFDNSNDSSSQRFYRLLSY
jgi:hypothetical protein